MSVFASFSQVVLRAKTQAGAMTLVECLCPALAGRGRSILVTPFKHDGGGWMITLSNEMCVGGGNKTELLSLTVVVREEPS